MTRAAAMARARRGRHPASPVPVPVRASAPAKVILLGEHGVNRGVTALATAVALRLTCTVTLRGDGEVILRSRTGERREDAASIDAHRARIEGLRTAGDHAALGQAAREDFFAATRFVLGGLFARLGIRGVEAEWSGALPVGRGLGSGAAASCALIAAVVEAAGASLTSSEVARLAWEGDVVAHGGTASALDASACAFGGVVAYDLERGGRPLIAPRALPLVVADTGVDADTGTVNRGVRERLERRPELAELFEAMAALTTRATDALRAGDLPRLGGLMRENQRLLGALGVSSPEIDALVAAALNAGAVGAKLSGSGGGGIVIALTEPDELEPVTAAMAAAGGRVLAAGAAVAAAPGARLEPLPITHHRSRA